MADKPLIPPPPYAGHKVGSGRILSLKHDAILEDILSARWAYIVSYDMNAAGDGHNYLPFILELQNSPDWCHFLTGTWLVIRHETLVDFSNLLLSKLHSKDRLLILPAKGPGAGWLPKDAWEWINKNLKSEW